MTAEIGWFAQAEYGTPKGRVGNWSACLTAPDITAAQKQAEKMLRKSRRVARLWHLRITGGGQVKRSP